MNDIRKERTRELYIEITCDLIRNQGMSAVTIRNISEKAGYNSATLYSYFDNLAHLILCAQLKFEEEIVFMFQNEIDECKITNYYEVWPHMYALMAKYYIENPNVFDCAHIAEIQDSRKSELREQRNQESQLQKYVIQCLSRIAEETKSNMEKMIQINQMCLAQVIGAALLHTKSRIDERKLIGIEEFEQKLRMIIHCFMED